MPRPRWIAATVLILCMMLSNGVAQEAQPPGTQPHVPAQYSAVAFGQSGPTAGWSFGLTIHVEGLTSDEELDELVSTLRHKGPDALVSALEDMKEKGRVAPTGSVGVTMPVVRIYPTKDGGQQIVLVTNRPISMWELYRGTRSRDYQFGVVVLNVDKDGNGTGTFAPVCKITFNQKNELEVEYYGENPFRLANVYRQQ